MNGPSVVDILNSIFAAPLKSVLVVAGILFLLLGILPINKISVKWLSTGKITQQWRVISAAVGGCLVILGVILPNPLPLPASCPGAPAQQVSIGDSARVCTAKDKVNLREKPSRTAKELAKLSPGTSMTVVDGPVCADNWSWWQVSVEDDTVGWIAEGGDESDPYFICPGP